MAPGDLDGCILVISYVVSGLDTRSTTEYEFEFLLILQHMVAYSVCICEREGECGHTLMP